MVYKTEVAIGEKWMYRIGSKDEPIHVEVLAVLPGAPARVKIKYLSGPQVGAEEEVPPTRLKVLWSKRHGFLEAEAQWRALASTPDAIESDAVESIVREFLWRKGARGPRL